MGSVIQWHFNIMVDMLEKIINVSWQLEFHKGKHRGSN
jgi:hypothetical protein